MNWSAKRSAYLEEIQKSHPRILDQARIHILFDFYFFAFLFSLCATFYFLFTDKNPALPAIGVGLCLFSLFLLKIRPFKQSLVLFSLSCFALQFGAIPYYSTGLLIFIVSSTIVLSSVLSFTFRFPWGAFFLWSSFISWCAIAYNKTGFQKESFFWIFSTALLASLSMHLLNNLFKNIKLQETILKHALAKQKDLNKEMEAFTYSASHDLQEPLRKIISFSDLFNQRFGDSLDPKAKLYLEHMTGSAQRMKHLIKSLLEYSRTGQSTLQYEQIDLQNFCTKIAHSFLPANEDIDLTIETPHTIRADNLQMERLFANLIENAWKYRKQDHPFIFKIRSEKENNGYWLRFEDNGIGIAPQFQQLVFQLFQRLHSPESIKGSGIGLSICKKIAEMHGGSMHLRSSLGEGSCFSLWLPDRKA